MYFNPADMEFPVGFNLLGSTPPEERHLVTSGIVSAFKAIWPDFWGPRLEYILFAAVADGSKARRGRSVMNPAPLSFCRRFLAASFLPSK